MALVLNKTTEKTDFGSIEIEIIQRDINLYDVFITDFNHTGRKIGVEKLSGLDGKEMFFQGFFSHPSYNGPVR